MRISSINTDTVGSNPIFNLSAVTKSTKHDHTSSDTINWVQSTENNQNLQHISVFIDKFSNVFTKDLNIFMNYVSHCTKDSEVVA